MKKISLFFVLLFWGSFLPVFGQEDPTSHSLLYGETVGGTFQDTASPGWEFPAEEREMIEIHIQRMGGQFTPRIQLLDPDGQPVSPNKELLDDDTHTLTFTDGFSQAGTYSIAVWAEENQEVEGSISTYSLSLDYLGTHRKSHDEGLPPLSTLGLGDFPDLFAGRSTLDNALKVTIYGQNTQVIKPNPDVDYNRFVASSAAYSIDIRNGNPIDLGITSFSFLDGGIGVAVTNNFVENRLFFTDQNIIAFEYVQNILTMTLQNGQQIITDFYRIAQMQAIEGMVVLNMVDGQRVILHGQTFDLQRDGGVSGRGPNAEPNNLFKIDTAHIITTDMLGWETLAYLTDTGIPQVRVHFGNDVRLISDVTRLDIYQRGHSTNPDLGEVDPRFLDINVKSNDQTIAINFDTLAMGDIVIQNGDITILPLDGREVTEPVAGTQNILVENAAIQYQFTDGRYRLSLPDSTEIHTPAPGQNEARNSPYDASFTPSGFNNLGTTFFNLRPQPDFTKALHPANRVNGNFYYDVQDFYIPSHTLSLNWQRYYNSLSPESLTPSYMMASPEPYLFKSMGTGWRHSYQYDLDITNARYGRIRLIWPDGAIHLFGKTGDSGSYRSTTLPWWVIKQSDGETGSWQAQTTDGETYQFDRAGRLVRIIDAEERSLLFSPAPRNILEQTPYSSGFFITEPYGRRLEVYASADGHIAHVFDPVNREIAYTHHNGLLVDVQYPGLEQSATYDYRDNLLSRVVDVRSPYHNNLSVQYDSLRRITQYTENPIVEDESLPVTTNFSYNQSGASNGVNTTVELSEVNGQLYENRWEYDGEFWLTRHQTPEPGWDHTYAYFYGYDYAPYTYIQGFSYSQPGRTAFDLSYNQWGYITQLEDPNYNGTTQYTFSYERLDNDRIVLKEILYALADAGQQVETFSYDEKLRLVSVARIVKLRPERMNHTTDYSYDQLGRLETITQPGQNGEEVMTHYDYNHFGYVTKTDEGNGEKITHFQYDYIGHLVSIRPDFVMASGSTDNTLTLVWDDERDLITSTEVGAFVESYQYDRFGNIVRVLTGDAEENYVYNGQHQVTSMTDSLGHVTTYQYDGHDNLLSVTLPGNRQLTYTFTYDKLDRPTRMTSPRELITAYHYRVDEAGLSSYKVDLPDGTSREYIFTTLGRIYTVREFDTKGNQTTNYIFDYDGMGSLRSLQESHNPAGRTITSTYDFLGHPLTTGINQKTTAYTYNPAGNLETVTDPGGNGFQYEYDTMGHIVAVTPPDGNREQFRYDANGNLIEFTSADDQTYSYTYDSLNRVIVQSGPLGDTIEYSYDSQGNLDTIIDELGNTIYWEYEGDHPISINDNTGNLAKYTYDETGALVGTDNSGRTTEFTYDLDGNIVAEVNQARRETLYGYDAIGRLTSVTDPLGHTTFYAYNNIGRISRTIDPLGNETRYTWSSSGNPIAQINPKQGEFVYNFNPFGQLVSISDHTVYDDIAINTRFQYDDMGNITDIYRGNSLNIQSPNGSRYQYTYTPIGQIKTFSGPEMATSQPWRFEYNGVGKMLKAIDPNGYETRYDYDDAGHILSITYAAGTEVETTETFAYDLGGNVIQYVAPNGTTSEFDYDARNRLRQRTETTEDGRSRTYLFEYDEWDYLSRVVDPAGNEVRYHHDFFGNLNWVRQISTDDEEDVVIEHRYEYDTANNMTSIAYPEGQLNNVTYNALNQQVRFVDAEESAWAYSYNYQGNLSQISDPLGNTVRYEYDGAGNIIEITHATGAVTEFAYDASGNLHNVKTPTNETRSTDFNAVENQRERIIYTLDRNGLLREIEHAPQEKTVFERDYLGRVTRMIDALGQTTAYAYDAQGHLTQTTSPDGTITWQYDAMGNITSIAGNNTQYRYEYDGFSNLVSMQSTDLTATYDYDEVGNVVVRDVGKFGQIRTTYDDFYRPTRVEYNGRGLDITYDRNGWYTRIAQDNGVERVYQYDDNGRIKSVLYTGSDGSRLDYLSYSYDSAGNTTRITRIDDWDVLYSYDTAHRVISERWLNANNETVYSIILVYDHLGNCIERTLNIGQGKPQHTLYEYNNKNQLIYEFRNVNFEVDPRLMNVIGFLIVISPALLWPYRKIWNNRNRRMLKYLFLLIIPIFLMGVAPAAPQNAEPTLSYTYDANGNLSTARYDTGGQLTFTYDAANRLKTIHGLTYDGITLSTEFTYDVLGRILQATVQGRPHRFIYDAYGLVGIINLAENTTENYLFDPSGNLAGILGAEGELWPLQDALGTTRKLTDGTGSLLNTTQAGYNYSAFSAVIEPYGADQAYDLPHLPQYLFNGHFYEPDAKLFIMDGRAYNPQLGRFIQRNPIRHDPQGSLYTTMNVQPDGYPGMTGGVLPEPPHIPLPQSAVPPSPTLITGATVTEDAPIGTNLQTVEFYRALTVGHTARYVINDFVTVLDPAFCDLYVRGVHPLPDPIRSLLQQPGQNIIDLYSPERGWRPRNTPDPTAKADPFVILNDTLPLLRLAENKVQPLQAGGCHEGWTMPSMAQPSIMPDELLNQFFDSLHTTVMFADIGQRVEFLTTMPQSLLDHPLPEPPAPNAAGFAHTGEYWLPGQIEQLVIQTTRDFYTGRPLSGANSHRNNVTGPYLYEP